VFSQKRLRTCLLIVSWPWNSPWEWLDTYSQSTHSLAQAWSPLWILDDMLSKGSSDCPNHQQVYLSLFQKKDSTLQPVLTSKTSQDHLKDWYPIHSSPISRPTGQCKVYTNLTSTLATTMFTHSQPWEEDSLPNEIWLFQVPVMPMGLTNAPAMFQAFMNTSSGHDWYLIVIYLNDILIFSDSLEDHWSMSDASWSISTSTTCTPNLRNACSIHRRLSSWLYVHPTASPWTCPRRCSQCLATLTNLKAVQVFLGFPTFIANHCGFSDIIIPWLSHTQGHPIHLGPNHKAFETLKEAFTQAPIWHISTLIIPLSLKLMSMFCLWVWNNNIIVVAPLFRAPGWPCSSRR